MAARLTTRPPAVTSSNRGVGATPRPGIVPGKKGSRPITVHPDLVTPDHPQREFQERFGASGHQCPGIFFDRLPVSSSTRLDAVQTSILVSRFFARLWEPSTTGDETIVAGVLATQKSPVQYLGGIQNEALDGTPKRFLKSERKILAEEGQKGRPRKYTDEDIADALDKTNGNISHASKILGAAYSTIHHRILAAPDNSRLAKYRVKKRTLGRTPKHSDKALAEFIEQASGNIQRAAELAGMSTSAGTIYYRIRLAKEDSDLIKYRDRKIQRTGNPGGRPPKHSDEALAAFIDQAGGNIKKAAKLAGVVKETIYARIRGAKEGPLLTKKSQKRERKKHSDADLAAFIDEASGDIKRAAELAGMATTSVYSRIYEASNESPLANLNTRKTSKPRGRQPRHSDADLAKFIDQTDGNVAKAAELAGMAAVSIYARIRQAKVDSPLAKRKTQKTSNPKNSQPNHSNVALSKTEENITSNPGGRPRKFSDRYLAECIELAGGNMTKAAELAGVAKGTLYTAIRRAKEGSPLFKRPLLGHRPKRSDDELARIIKQTGGNIKEAAKRSGMSIASMYRRISEAPTKSQLAEHRRGSS